MLHVISDQFEPDAVTLQQRDTDEWSVATNDAMQTTAGNKESFY
jgi:hypothetical protein